MLLASHSSWLLNVSQLHHAGFISKMLFPPRISLDRTLSVIKQMMQGPYFAGLWRSEGRFYSAASQTIEGIKWNWE